MSGKDSICDIKLVVGLGNPGQEYAGTRHNCGFMALERVLKLLKNTAFEERHMAESRVWFGRFRGKALLLQMPLTFMNCSGSAVAKLARKENILPEEILVIYDDMDFPVGKLRLKSGGSAGGHNGIGSLIDELGSAAFHRLRIGIGRPATGQMADYVLSKVSPEEAEMFACTLDAAADAVVCVLSGGIARAMNQFNHWSPALKENEDQQIK